MEIIYLALEKDKTHVFSKPSSRCNYTISFSKPNMNLYEDYYLAGR